MKQFIGEEIQVELPGGVFLEKKPTCPEELFWRDQRVIVSELRSSWFDYSRKGDAASNMREEHLRRAKSAGSWGVGRFYFEILAEDGLCYTIYYDRAPASAQDRKGKWILFTLDAE